MAAVTGSAWSPLRHPLFRGFWIAVLASQVGTWMQNAGGSWLMTSLTTSPALVALMQAAAILLALTFAIGLGVAMSGPAWQATAPRLVPPDDLPAAVALNGVAVNLGR